MAGSGSLGLWAILKALDFILQATEDQGKFACGHACRVKN